MCECEFPPDPADGEWAAPCARMRQHAAVTVRLSIGDNGSLPFAQVFPPCPECGEPRVGPLPGVVRAALRLVWSQ